jgi:hypothetical protein
VSELFVDFAMIPSVAESCVVDLLLEPRHDCRVLRVPRGASSADEGAVDRSG